MNRGVRDLGESRIAECALAQSLAVLMAHVRSWQRQACVDPRGQAPPLRVPPPRVVAATPGARREWCAGRSRWGKSVAPSLLARPCRASSAIYAPPRKIRRWCTSARRSARSLCAHEQRCVVQVTCVIPTPIHAQGYGHGRIAVQHGAHFLLYNSTRLRSAHFSA